MRVIVFGRGGHARVVNEIFGEELLDYEALPDIEGEFIFVVGIGDNEARRRVYLDAISKGVPGKALHPDAVVSPFCRIGSGTVVCAAAVIQFGAEIGVDCIINTAASVDHDCVIDHHSHIAPGARLCGNVSIGARTLIGAGAIIIPGVSVGSNCIVGAGSVVTNDVPDGATVKGNPAK